MLGPPIPTHAVLERGISPALRGDLGVRLSSTAAMASEYEALRTLARRGDDGAKDLVAQLDGLAPIVPATYPCNLLGVRNPGGPLETIRAAGRPLEVGTGFERVTTYRGQLYTSIAAIKLAQANPATAVADFPARGREADRHLREQLAANETALKALDEQIQQHGTLLTRAKVYLAGVEG